MFFRKKKRVVGIGIMLVLTAFISMQTTVSASGLPPVADAGGPYVFDECDPAHFDASASFDPNNDTLHYRWKFDGNWTEWSLDPYQDNLWRDDYHGMILLEVSDGDLTSQDTAEVTISNVVPSILDITGPLDPVNVGNDVNITVDFMDGDPRVGGSLDLHYATFYWGDNSLTEYDLASGIFSVIGSHAYTEAGEFEISIVLQDEHGGTTTGTYYVTIVTENIPSVEAGPDALINEGDTYVSGGTVALFDISGYTAVVNYGDGSVSVPLVLIPDDTLATFDLNHHYCENGIYTVLVTVFDSDGMEWGSDTATVTVLNVPPTIVSFTGPSSDPLQLGVSINVNGQFTDPGCLDTHIAIITWDDTQETSIDLPLGVYHLSATHQYQSAGVYTITLTVWDDDGGFDSKTLDFYVVVYDPNSGFVTGGGWIICLPGSYPADPSLSGRANFGFVSKYQRGKSAPQGNTEFQFQIANLNFHSQVYEWLVIAGAKATYKGTGTINGHGNYGFLLSAVDGDLHGGGGVDKFRIKIWDKDNNNVIIFDNNLGLPDDGDPATALSGGQITIHKA